MREKISRRRLLGAFGSSAAGIAGLSKIGTIKGSDFVEVPIFIQLGKVIETEKVPRRWYEHNKKSRRVLNSKSSTVTETNVC